MHYDRLTAADTTFLRIETPHEPQHVGSLSVLDGAPLRDETGRIRFEELKAHVDHRVDKVPRLRQKVVEVPYGQARPVWVDDHDFDIDYHVRLTALPRPGTDDQLAALMSRLQELALDRERPLWEMWIVDGLADDEIGLIIKTHHALGDGIANVDLALALVDTTDTVDDEIPESTWIPRTVPTREQLLRDALRDQLSQPIRIAQASLEALRHPRETADTVAGVGRTLAEFAFRPQAAPWNQPVSAHRRWVHADVDFAALERVRAHHDVTINDVVLAACSGALRTYLAKQGEDVVDREMKAMVPVSLREEDEHGETLGNRVAMVLVELPVHEADPLQRLALVHDAASEVKGSNLVVGSDLIIKAANAIAPLSGPLTRFVSRRIPMNLVITNIPGPPVPLYLRGARIDRTYPYVEVIDIEGLTIAVVSYCERMYFGITSDRDAMPDLGDLADAVEREFLELADAAELAAPKKKRKSKPKKAKPSAKKAKKASD